MRDNFLWERDTANYHRYVSESKQQNGKHAVLYLPIFNRTRPPRSLLEGIIISESDQPCQSYLKTGYDIHRAAGAAVNFAELYGTRGPFEIHGTETGRFSSRHAFNPPYAFDAAHLESRFGRFAGGVSDHDQIAALTKRVFKLEQQQSILFKAVDKIIRKLGWVKKLRPKKFSIDIETTFDPIVVTAADDKGHVMVIDVKK